MFRLAAFGAGVAALLAFAAARPATRPAGLAYADGTRTPVSAVTHRSVKALSTVDDPLYGQQWGFGATDTPDAWQLARTLQPVIVAVVDSGVDASHPDLAGKVLPGWNLLANNANTADDNGHGTAVAGIIGAVTGNGTGVASYCWRCLILPVKVLDANGVGDNGTVAAGIRWAADHGARVINVSLGTLVDDGALRDAVAYARSKGSVVVAAAGNLGMRRLEYPAADPGALAVGGSDTNGALFNWSANGSWVQLAAPGSNLTTARGGGYNGFTGTSAAAPVVSGIAALTLSVAPRANADQVVTALEQGARPMGGVQFGIVDAGRTLAAVLASAPRARTSARVGASAHFAAVRS